MEWIGNLDRHLCLLREEEAEVYYRASVGTALDADHLQSIASRRRAILTDEADAKARDVERVSDVPIVRRKAKLLQLLILTARIEEDPELLSLRHELEQAEFTETNRTREGMRQFQNRIAPCARARTRRANEVSRHVGFRDFVEARCACQELDVASLERAIRWAIGRFRAPAMAMLGDADIRSLSALELDLHAKSLCITPDAPFSSDSLCQLLERYLQTLGICHSAGLIKVEWAKMTFPGSVHALKIGHDVRVVMREGDSGFTPSVTFFHEYGHALYYAHVPDSVLLLDTRIGREGLAEVMAGLVVDGDWLLAQGNLPAAVAKETLRKHQAWEAYQLLSLARETLFDVALYRGDGNFEEAWNTATRECFGVDDTTGIYPYWVFIYPLDMKDYLFARAIRESVLADLHSRFGMDIHHPTAGEHLLEQYYETANASPWHERFPLGSVQGYLSA
jgi:hypothetical protein